MDQEQFDAELGLALSSPVPTLIVLAIVAAFVAVGWLS